MATQRTTQNVNVTIDRNLLSRARALGINLSQTFTTAIDAELRKHEAACWKEENAEGIANLNAFLEEHGSFSDQYRTF
ncbi:antitoxin [Leclercia adecarboxylata]|nr:antitoxin [Leclercia adecarboxylata]KMN66808.1 antitoxin [Leclercia sp. LK8]